MVFTVRRATIAEADHLKEQWVIGTKGIGENDFAIRSGICAGLEGLGIELDSALNASTRATETVISKPSSRVKLMVIPTNEELVVARETKRLLENSRN